MPKVYIIAKITDKLNESKLSDTNKMLEALNMSSLMTHKNLFWCFYERETVYIHIAYMMIKHYYGSKMLESSELSCLKRIEQEYKSKQDIFQTSLLIPFSQSKYLVHDQFQFAFRGISGIADQINT